MAHHYASAIIISLKCYPRYPNSLLVRPIPTVLSNPLYQNHPHHRHYYQRCSSLLLNFCFHTYLPFILISPINILLLWFLFTFPSTVSSIIIVNKPFPLNIQANSLFSSNCCYITLLFLPLTFCFHFQICFIFSVLLQIHNLHASNLSLSHILNISRSVQQDARSVHLIMYFS